MLFAGLCVELLGRASSLKYTAARALLLQNKLEAQYNQYPTISQHRV